MKKNNMKQQTSMQQGTIVPTIENARLHTAPLILAVVEVPAPTRKIEISDEAKDQLHIASDAEGQVILHISYTPGRTADRIRIWPTTYLIPHGNKTRSELIHAENIGRYPHWLIIPVNKEHIFTLVFSPLPKGCIYFDLFEDIPEPGGFLIKSIKRNQTDVYHLRLR
jgi:hypothetical protein